MALVDATFAIPEDKEDTDSSDSDNDVSSVEGKYCYLIIFAML